MPSRRVGGGGNNGLANACEFIRGIISFVILMRISDGAEMGREG